jgi:hypothetical protein
MTCPRGERYEGRRRDDKQHGAFTWTRALKTLVFYISEKSRGFLDGVREHSLAAIIAAWDFFAPARAMRGLCVLFVNSNISLSPSASHHTESMCSNSQCCGVVIGL